MRRSFVLSTLCCLLSLAAGLSCGDAPTAPLGRGGEIAAYTNPGPTLTPGFRIVTSNPVAGQAVTVDASASVSPTPMVSFAWQWGDGTAVTTRSTPTGGVHAYAAAGSYQVTLTVCDQNAACNSVSQVVTIGGGLVDLDFTPPATLYAFADVSLSVLGTADPAGNAGRYAWQFVNGATTLSDTGRTVAPLFAVPGTYVVTIRAQIPGAPGSTVLRTLYVGPNQRPAQPTLSCAPVSVAMNATVACTAAGGSDPDGDAITWEWSSDGRQSATTTTASYAWPTAGTYGISVNTRDGKNARSLATLVNVTVSANLPPTTPTLSCAPLAPAPNQVVTCTAAGSTDPEGGAVTYTFSADGRQSVSGATATYAWGATGQRTVTVAATDAHGASSALASTVLSVAAATPLPTSVGGLVLWLRADTLTTVTNGRVTAWRNIAGSAGTLAASAMTAGPTLTTLGGRPALHFDRLQSTFLQFPALADMASGRTTVFLVAAPAAGSNGTIIDNYSYMGIGPTDMDSYVGWRIETAYGNYNTFYYAGEEYTSRGVGGGTPPGILINRIGYNAMMWSNGTPGTALLSYGLQNPRAVPVHIGGLSDDAGTTMATYTGDLAEVLVYRADLNTTEITMVQNYLAARYGVAPTAITAIPGVANQPPGTPLLSCTPGTAAPMAPITCTASGAEDPEGGAVTYHFSPQGLVSQQGGTATYQWGMPGTLNVQVYASDASNQSTVWVTTPVTIANAARLPALRGP